MRLRLLAALAAVLTAVCSSAAAPADVPAWTASWGTAQALAIPVSGWGNQTLRMVARTSLGGTQLRLRLANPFASSTAQFGEVTIGVQQNGGTVVAPAPVAVTFGGYGSLTLPPGASAASDPIPLAVPANTRLLVSLYIAPGADVVSAPVHQTPDEVEYNYVGGDIASSQAYTTTNTFNFSTYLAGIDVPSAAPSTVVAVGDSITDGVGALVDANTRWPDYLAGRVVPLGLAVVNEGITADQVAADQASAPSLTSRWQRDVLGLPGVRTVIVAAGINDLRSGMSASALEVAQASLIAQAHAAGVRVLLSTLTPCGGAPNCGPTFEAQRLAYNAWVRSAVSGADGIADFDAAVGGWGTILNPSYDCGDHIHPNSQGYNVMANAIPLGAL